MYSMARTPWTCSMDTDMQNEYRHAAWTWTCTMVKDMQRRHGYPPWLRTCSVDMDMHHGHLHAPWTWKCTMIMDMDTHHGQMDMYMQNGHGYKLSFHVRWQLLRKHIIFCQGQICPVLSFREAIFQKLFLSWSYTKRNFAPFRKTKWYLMKICMQFCFAKQNDT